MGIGSVSHSDPEVAHVLDIVTVQSLPALLTFDEQLFVALVDRYQESMIRIACRYVADMDTAADVVQETWLAVLRGLQHFEQRASFKTWLFAILRNRARSRAKQEWRQIPFSDWETAASDQGKGQQEQSCRQQHRPQTELSSQANGGHTHNRFLNVSPTCQPEEVALTQETHHLLIEAIKLLPRRQREVLILHDIEGRTKLEICATLHLSDANQRVLLFRARAKIRNALHQYLASI
ncbi:MAG: sigma-70 family RNA polymerase sigma factor [Caldilineaceae bacterium]